MHAVLPGLDGFMFREFLFFFTCNRWRMSQSRSSICSIHFLRMVTVAPSSSVREPPSSRSTISAFKVDAGAGHGCCVLQDIP